MENLAAYTDKFSESGKRILESSLNETRRREQHFIAPEHILYALIIEEPELFDATMRKHSIDPQKVRIAVEKRLDNFPQHTGKSIRLAPDTTDIFRHSMEKARSEDRRVIDAKDICSVMATAAYYLLEDILQNPETPAPIFGKRKLGAEENQSDFPLQSQIKPGYFPSQLQIESSSFFSQFSLKDLVKKNSSPSGLLCASNSGGIGFGSGIGDLEQSTQTIQESLNCPIKSADFIKFNEEEFVASLIKDLEDDINKSGLKIKEINLPNSSSFHIEYEAEKTKGRVDISGAMLNGYYKLNAMIVETSGQKIKS